jgi:copper(I)-binding protein
MTRSGARRLGVTISAMAWVVTAWGQDAPAVSQAWSRATPPGVDVGAAYMIIQGGSRPDALVGADCERAAMVHLHVVEEAGGVTKMRPIESVEVPAGRRVELAPKSTHLMLMGLDGPLVAGQAFQMTLHFAGGGTRTVTVAVRPAADDGASSSQDQ